MPVPTTSLPGIKKLYCYPHAPNDWIAHIGNVDYVIPKVRLNQDSDVQRKVADGYIHWNDLFNIASHFLTADGQWKMLGIRAPDWTPLWLKVIGAGSIVDFEVGLELVGDDYGDWIVTIKNGAAVHAIRVNA
ncbi:hypothetical protein [Chromobacterium sp. Beijing]|uniref:hypothetical protein n=1 Tax=Chromobacterium sp. Beijing TaxID=2735795 RepID=UPI001F3F4043|nr:hypothetical protein [Chromobacterium sp. Beijing]UJB33243.1 hypothetical protein HQN78_20565 [Chromobacterium sp. Beijing]